MYQLSGKLANWTSSDESLDNIDKISGRVSLWTSSVSSPVYPSLYTFPGPNTFPVKSEKVTGSIHCIRGVVVDYE